MATMGIDRTGSHLDEEKNVLRLCDCDFNARQNFSQENQRMVMITNSTSTKKLILTVLQQKIELFHLFRKTNELRNDFPQHSQSQHSTHPNQIDEHNYGALASRQKIQ